MGVGAVERLDREVRGLSATGLSWTDLVVGLDTALRRVVSFDRSCWHTVDPGTILLTGSVNRDVPCDGAWLAKHEYEIEDVNKWAFLAHSGRGADATSLATHGDLTRSARHRSQMGYGIGDELRVSFVVDGVCWAAAGLLRDTARPFFTEQDVAILAGLAPAIAVGARRGLVSSPSVVETAPEVDGPGVVLFDVNGEPESISPAAQRWIELIPEDPPPRHPTLSRVVQAVAARTRSNGSSALGQAARTRVRTRSGMWLLLYGTTLSGARSGGTAVVIQPAAASDVAPLVAMAYALTDRERAVTALCLEGRSTKQMASLLHMSTYTVQDHLKAIFTKTGVHSRGELVGQIFTEHRLPRWENLADPPSGWHGFAEH